jgi:prepilin-type N-terminal cleavage/methylation domain-containing protein
MIKRHLSRRGFTLIEVMVAVMIVSVVIAALLQMRGNTTHKLQELKKRLKTTQYNSFLSSLDDKYGFESSNIDLYRLAGDFDMESGLRRKLKSIKTKITYKKIDVLDSNDFDEDGENNATSSIILEIGKTDVKSKDFSLSLLRVKLQ